MAQPPSNSEMDLSEVFQLSGRVDKRARQLAEKARQLPQPDARGRVSPGTVEVMYFATARERQQLEQDLQKLKGFVGPLGRRVAQRRQDLNSLRPAECEAGDGGPTGAARKALEEQETSLRWLEHQAQEVALTIRLAENTLEEIRAKAWPGGNPRGVRGEVLQPKPKELFGTSAKPTGPPFWRDGKLWQPVQHRGITTLVDPTHYPAFSVERAEELLGQSGGWLSPSQVNEVSVLEDMIEKLRAYHDGARRQMSVLEAKVTELAAGAARMNGEAAKRQLEWGLANARAELRRCQTVAAGLAQRLSQAREALRRAQVRAREEQRRREQDERQRKRAIETERRKQEDSRVEMDEWTRRQDTRRRMSDE